MSENFMIKNTITASNWMDSFQLFSNKILRKISKNRRILNYFSIFSF